MAEQTMYLTLLNIPLRLLLSHYKHQQRQVILLADGIKRIHLKPQLLKLQMVQLAILLSMRSGKWTLIGLPWMPMVACLLKMEIHQKR